MRNRTIQKLVSITLLTLSATVFADYKINWAGPYIGAQVGASNSQSSYDTSGPSEHFDQSKTKSIYGFQGGYNFSINDHFLIGAEASYLNNFNDSFTTSAAQLTSNRSRNSRVNEIWTVAPRLAYISDKWLGFVKGGFASANFNFFGVNTSSELKTAEFNTRANGWILGLGAEYLLSDHISAGIEYDHMNFNIGTHQVVPLNGIILSATNNYLANINPNIDALYLRLNYKF